MKQVIQWLDTRCERCIKCLKSCPTEAISIVNHKVMIQEEKCIHCDVCVKACPAHVLKVQNAHLSENINKHKYNVILIPTSLLSDLKSFDEFQKICQSILNLGFDELVQYSDIEGFLYQQSLLESHQKEGIWLTSFCPTLNQLIEKNYPTLLDRLLPYDYPVEIAARQVRERLKEKDVGIFSLCECVGKMLLAKEPYENPTSAIDYAMTISHIFPKISKFKKQDKHPIEMNRDGVKSNVGDFYVNNQKSVIRVEGLNQTKTLLELIEFDRIHHVDLVAMYACYQGCIGGHYLWSNPFEGYYNMTGMIDACHREIMTLNESDYRIERQLNQQDMQSMEERMMWFHKVNDVLDKLPQYDCGACGFANCRSLAQDIVDGKADITICRIRKGEKHEVK